MENHYTKPEIKKGKEVTFTPKNSRKEIEQAKQVWYIEYYFNGKQIRVRPHSLNRIKDPKEKQYRAEIELDTIKKQLADGFDPTRPEKYLEKISKSVISYKDAVKIFFEYHKTHQSKPKTISSYKSKLTALESYLPQHIKLHEITLKQLEDFAKLKIEEQTWAQATLSAYKRAVSTFFTVMIELGYAEKNTYKGFNKRIKSFKETAESHLPYNDEQLKNIMQWLDANDRFGALFCRTIYFTCLRPAEIRTLKVRDLNIENRKLTVRAINRKVTSIVKDDIIDLPKSFIPFLNELNIKNANKEDFIFGDFDKIIGKEMTGVNAAYNRLIKCLEASKLDKQGFDLYSLKHTSNINRLNNGWSIAQIMVANRHTNVEQTLNYLKDINKNTEIRDLDVPTI